MFPTLLMRRSEPALRGTSPKARLTSQRLSDTAAVSGGGCSSNQRGSRQPSPWSATKPQLDLVHPRLRSDQRGMIGAESRLLIGAGADPEHQRSLVVPPVRGAEQPHPQLLTYPGRSLVVRLGHGPDLLKLKCEPRVSNARAASVANPRPQLSGWRCHPISISPAPSGRGSSRTDPAGTRLARSRHRPAAETVDRRPAGPACVE